MSKKSMHPELKKMLEDFFDKHFEETRTQRVWVGLSDEQKRQLNESLNLQGRYPIIDAIEAQCKGNNT